MSDRCRTHQARCCETCEVPTNSQPGPSLKLDPETLAERREEIESSEEMYVEWPVEFALDLLDAHADEKAARADAEARAIKAVMDLVSAETLARLRGDNVERLYAERDALEARLEEAVAAHDAIHKANGELHRNMSVRINKAEQERDDLQIRLDNQIACEGQRVAELEVGIQRQDRRLPSLADSPLANRCVTCGHVKHNDLGYCQIGQCSCGDGTTVGRLASILMRDLRALTKKGADRG